MAAPGLDELPAGPARVSGGARRSLNRGQARWIACHLVEHFLSQWSGSLRGCSQDWRMPFTPPPPPPPPPPNPTPTPPPTPPRPPSLPASRSCILRWWLSRWNYQIKGRWQWYPAGTFAANMLGTAITFGLQASLCSNIRTARAVFAMQGQCNAPMQAAVPTLSSLRAAGFTPAGRPASCRPHLTLAALPCSPRPQCILQRELAASLGYWGGLMVGAVQVGFCGSLTTVSTYVTEVGTLNKNHICYLNSSDLFFSSTKMPVRAALRQWPV